MSMHDATVPQRMWVFRYTLTPCRPLSAVARPGQRRGALIRTDHGFADLHPWPELGDAALDEQLFRLSKEETTALTRRSLAIAEADGAARQDGRSLFEGLKIPASHWPGNDPPPAFDTAKIKGQRDLPPRIRLRLDFNATLTPEEFERIAKTLPRDRIDFVEDPCPYDAASWKRLRDRTGLRLALDRGDAGDGVDVLVVKPARQEFPESAEKEIVVTSYMDHALGQFGAAWIAAQHAGRVSARCGLFTHVLFDRDPFFERVRADGPYLLPPAGTGIGFDDLLENLPWKRLS